MLYLIAHHTHPPQVCPSFSSRPSPFRGRHVQKETPSQLAHVSSLHFQLLPQLLQSLLHPGSQGGLLTLLPNLQLLSEQLQLPPAFLFQAGPLSLLQRLQLLSQPLQGSLLCGPGETQWPGSGPGPSEASSMGRIAHRVYSPHLDLICFRTGLELSSELRQPLALLFPYPGLLVVGGFLQLLF